MPSLPRSPTNRFHFRVCRPEVYRTRLLVYRAIKAITASLGGRANNTRSGNRGEALVTLQVLLPVFDEILCSEYDPSHSAIPFSQQKHLPVCDFCGADIFQSWFECCSCLDIAAAGPYQMCAGCYVEGRKCCCGSLRPVQRIPFDNLIADRNKAASYIGNGVAIPLLDYRYASLPAAMT